MTRVSGLLFGAFITSCVLSFGLWINTQVNLSVEMADITPARVLSTSGIDNENAPRKSAAGQSLISIGDSGTNSAYLWGTPSQSRADSMTQLVAEELGEYTKDYLEAIGLNEIILVNNIKTHSGSPVLGFTDPLRGQVYLNAIAVEGENSRAIVAEQTLHHELAHLLAYEQYGYLFEHKSEWARLAEDFDYGQHNQAKSEYFPEDGFVTRYSMSSANEDFAEVYSLVFTEYFQDKLETEAGKSGVLSDKLSFVYDSIAEASLDQCYQSPLLNGNVCAQE